MTPITHDSSKHDSITHDPSTHDSSTGRILESPWEAEEGPRKAPGMICYTFLPGALAQAGSRRPPKEPGNCWEAPGKAQGTPGPQERPRGPSGNPEKLQRARGRNRKTRELAPDPQICYGNPLGQKN